MKKLIGCVMIALTAGGTFALEQMSPYDDAIYWFRGGVDLNGNGFLDSNSHEFRDVTHMSNTNGASHLCKWNNGSYGKVIAKTGRVVMPYANRVLTSAPYLHLEQKVVTNRMVTVNEKEYPEVTLSSDYLNLPGTAIFSSVPSGVDVTNYTIFVRFRQTELVSENQKVCNFLQVGFDWNGRSGISFALTKKENGAHCPDFFCGQTQLYSWNHNWREGHWNDMAVSVSNNVYTFVSCGNISDKDGSITNELLTVERVSYTGTADKPAIQAGRRGTFRLGGEESGSVTFTNGVNGTSGNRVKAWRGDIHSIAFWTRALSVDEIRKVFSETRPALVRMGMANGTADEFQKLDDSVNADSIHPETWNPVLNAAHPSASVTFLVASDAEKTSQYLRIRPTPDSVEATVSVSLDGRSLGKETKISSGDILYYIEGKYLTAASHTLTFTRTDDKGGDFAIDAFSVDGSWRIGDSKNASHGGMEHENTRPAYIPRVYPVTDGNLHHFARGFCGGDNGEHIITFDVPMDLVALTRDPTLTIHYSQTGSAQTFDISFNGEKFDTAAVSGATTLSYKIPAAKIRAGENRVTITQKSGGWCNCDMYKFELGRLISGAMLILK